MSKEVFESRGLHGKDELVEKVKEKAGELYALFSEATNEPGTDAVRHYALAKTNLEQSVMWFVKGISRSVK